MFASLVTAFNAGEMLMDCLIYGGYYVSLTLPLPGINPNYTKKT
jgi:hypothetical protein